MQGRLGSGMFGEKSELRDTQIPKDLASDPEFALIHGNHLRTDAVGSREVGGVDVLFASRIASRVGDQIDPAGPFAFPATPKMPPTQTAISG